MDNLNVYASPLPFSNKQIQTSAPVGTTVKDIVNLICPARFYQAGIGAVVFINGHQVFREKWHCIKPKAGTVINVRIVPQGGGGGKKSPLASLLSIAVLIAAPYAGAAFGSTLGLSILGNGVLTAGQTAFFSGVVSATVGVVGKLLISAIAPPPKPSNYGNAGSDPSESPTQFIEGAQNSLNPFGVVPICLGTNRMFPLQAARPYSETQDNDQYVRQLFTYGYGDALLVDDFRIGETALSEFSDFEMAHRLAGDLHLPTGLYSDDIYQNDFNVLLQQVDGYTVRTTQPGVDEAIVDVTFPQGLASFNSNGNRVADRVQVELQYSIAEAGAWVSTAGYNVYASQTEALRQSLRIIFPANNTYDIRLRRLSADTVSDQRFNKVYLTAIKSVAHRAPVNLVGLNGTAVRIRATDQLNGALDQFNALVSNVIPDYNAPTGTWLPRATSNPASLYRYVLQGTANARPLADSKIDLPTLEDWHAHCAAQGYTYNRVIDYEASVDAILRDIASAGAASPAIVDGRRTVVIDRAKADIVQVITPRNSSGYSGEMTYPELPHAFRVQFRNAQKGYQQDERIVYDDGYDETNATEFENLELQSCTSSDLAFKTARRHIASARLRPETHTFMLDVENLVALRGDRIILEHDVPIIGVGDGRIKTVLTAGDTVTGFTLDDTVTIPDTGDYYVRIRLGDGTLLYKQLNAVPGDFTVFSFISPFPLADAPAPGDLCAFFEAGGELDLVITKIDPQDDLTARITAVDYAPGIFTAESATIPPFDSNITTPLEFIRPVPPVLITAQSDETVMLRNSDGSFTSRAVFTLRNDNEGNVDVQVKVRRSGTTVFTNANVLEATAERLILTGLDSGARYDIHIRYARRIGGPLSLPLQLNNYRFVGSSGLPADVSGFLVTISGDTALFKWNPNDEIDLSHYRIKFSSTFIGAQWETAQIIEDRVQDNRVSLNFLAGTYLIKAVDLSGNESAHATAVITYDPGLVRNVVATLDQQPGFAGVKDNVVVDSGTLVLDNAALNLGYYYFADTLDLTGIFTVFVRATVDANGAFVNGGAGNNNLFAEDDVFAIEDVFGIGSDGWSVQLEYRRTLDDPTLSPVWTDWMPLSAGNSEFWGMQFRLRLNSFSTNVSPQIMALTVIADVPDRIERGEDLTVPTSGATVTYSADFMDNPALAITIQGGSANDQIEYVAKDAGGFTIRVYNIVTAGYVARSIDYIASGYGRKKV